MFAVTAPAAYEANAGVFVGVAPPGTTGLRVFVAGQSFSLRFVLRHRRFSFGPNGLPVGDETVTLVAYHDRHELDRVSIGPVFGLPRTAGIAAPARLYDPGIQQRLAGLRSQAGAVDAVWARDLVTGRTASYNASAEFTAASTFKLAILTTALVRQGGNPVANPNWGTENAMIINSDNHAANSMLTSIGGSTVAGSQIVDNYLRQLGLTESYMIGGYAGARQHRPGPELPPSEVQDQPNHNGGLHDSAHDLGILLNDIVDASDGFGPAWRSGLSPRAARVALWLLIHAVYPGLVRPNLPFVVGHKAGWISTEQHDAAVVFTNHGIVIVVMMTHHDGGISYGASVSYGAAVLRVIMPYLAQPVPIYSHRHHRLHRPHPRAG